LIFKLCRSLADGHKVPRKDKSSSSETKIVQIGAESLKIFPSRPEKGTNGLSFFALEGKIDQEHDSNFGEKTALRSRSFETVVSSLELVCKKLRQTPETPTPPPPPPPPNTQNPGPKKGDKKKSFFVVPKE